MKKENYIELIREAVTDVWDSHYVTGELFGITQCAMRDEDIHEKDYLEILMYYTNCHDQMMSELFHDMQKEIRT